MTSPWKVNMKISLLVLFLAGVAGCVGAAEPAPTTPTPPPPSSDNPYCEAAPAPPAAQMPAMQPYAGALPPAPVSAGATAIMLTSPDDPNLTWAVFVDNDQVVAWQAIDDGDLAAYRGKLLDGDWGTRGVPLIGVNPPPPPVDGTGKTVRYFLEVARLFRAIPQIAAQRAQ
jgi:hypothetical protein